MRFEQSAAAERGASSSLVVCIVTETPILVRVGAVPSRRGQIL